MYFFPQPSMVADPGIRVRERDDLPMSGVTLLVEVRDYLDRGMDMGSDFGGRHPCRSRLLSRSDRRHTTGLAVSGLPGEREAASRSGVLAAVAAATCVEKASTESGRCVFAGNWLLGGGASGLRRRRRIARALLGPCLSCVVAWQAKQQGEKKARLMCLFTIFFTEAESV